MMQYLAILLTYMQHNCAIGEKCIPLLGYLLGLEDLAVMVTQYHF